MSDDKLKGGNVVAKLTPTEKTEKVSGIFASISEEYDIMNDLESFGLHRYWKSALIRKVGNSGARKVLDVACGTGDITLWLAQRLPELQVTGLDFSAEMLAVANRRLTALAQTPEVEFVQGDAMQLPFASDSFDLVCISFGLRNMPDYEAALQEMVRVLRPGGVLLCLDASYPTNPLVVVPFRLYFSRIMPAMASLVVNKPDEYRWLNDSTEAFLSKPALRDLFAKVGLTQTGYRSFMFGAAALHWGAKPL